MNGAHRSKKQFAIIDQETQKAVDGFGLIIPKYAPHPYQTDGAQVAQSALRGLAVNPELSKRALRIALWLISRIERRGPALIRRSEMIDELGMDKSDVSKGLYELCAHANQHDRNGELFRPILPPGKKPVVGVRPSVAWKGSSADLVEAIRTERAAEERLKAVDVRVELVGS